MIGVAGSVAVGKSTTARLLQALLAGWPDHPKVELVTTDGFLFPNAELERRVTQRTEELNRTNSALTTEMAEREAAETRVRHLRDELAQAECRS